MQSASAALQQSYDLYSPSEEMNLLRETVRQAQAQFRK